MIDEQLVLVRLAGIPPTLYAAAHAHQEELLREFMHIANAGPQDRGSIPLRLLRLMEEVRTAYGRTADAARGRVEAGLDAGEASVDITYEVPRSAGAHAETLLATLEEADAFCRSGDLLTLEPSPEILAFRGWYLGEVVRQTAGEAPRPWPEHRRAPAVP